MTEKITKQTREVVDAQTGELLEYSRDEEIVSFSSTTEEPDYVKLYCEAWASWKGIDHVRMPVVAAMLPYMTFAEDGQVIMANSYMKKNICAKLGITMKVLNNEITRLVKANVLRRIERGTFQVNPELVGKGNWTNIKRLRATFEIVGDDAGTITLDLEENDD